jgi:hypothetical protein
MKRGAKPLTGPIFGIPPIILMQFPLLAGSPTKKHNKSPKEPHTRPADVEVIPKRCPFVPRVMSTFCQLYCVCRDVERDPMVACDGCDVWFHWDCVGENGKLPAKRKKWFCGSCQPVMVMKVHLTIKQTTVAHFHLQLGRTVANRTANRWVGHKWRQRDTQVTFVRSQMSLTHSRTRSRTGKDSSLTPSR